MEPYVPGPVLWKRAPRPFRIVGRLCLAIFIVLVLIAVVRRTFTAVERNRSGHANPARTHGVRPVPSPSRNR